MSHEHINDDSALCLMATSSSIDFIDYDTVCVLSIEIFSHRKSARTADDR